MSEILKTLDDVIKKMEEIHNTKEPKTKQPVKIKELLAKAKSGKKQ